MSCIRSLTFLASSFVGHTALRWLAAGLLLALLAPHTAQALPTPAEVRADHRPSDTLVLSREGEVLQRVRTDATPNTEQNTRQPGQLTAHAIVDVGKTRHYKHRQKADDQHTGRHQDGRVNHGVDQLRPQSLHPGQVGRVLAQCRSRMACSTARIHRGDQQVTKRLWMCPHGLSEGLPVLQGLGQ